MNFRTSPANLLSVDELVIASAYLGVLVDRVRDNGNQVPTALQNELNEVDLELSRKTRADKLRRLESLRLQKQAYLSKSEKLQLADAEIQALEAELEPRPAGKAVSKVAGRK